TSRLSTGCMRVGAKGLQSGQPIFRAGRVCICRCLGGHGGCSHHRPTVRIGLLAPPFETVPPERYGGTERVLAALADSLVQRGHDVTLFAARGSSTSAKLGPTVDDPIWHRDTKPDERAIAALSIGRAFRHATDLDVMHNHMGYAALAAAR